MLPQITIGLAGHIDHGKTTLTKTLTNVDTDRLKEEKERKISIENGFAYLDLTPQHRAAVIDVPGHEKFIRKMIAGIAGIDLVMLVVAADEGVMPQTKEHFDIVRLLNIKHLLITVTKTSLVDVELLELVQEDIQSLVKETDYKDAPIHYVDSVDGTGVSSLRYAITNYIEKIEAKPTKGPFRMPIDHVFTSHGIGTIVRGTIFNGTIIKNDLLTLLPSGKQVKIRELQVHNESKEQASAGQRAALNLSGLSREDVNRGDVLVSSNLYQDSKRLDISLTTINDFKPDLKQRSPVALHIGTSTVLGRLILFDRNRLGTKEKVLAQIELEKPVVAKKGDRFILRRPTPAETIGGGFIVDVRADKHRFGEDTIHTLKAKAENPPDTLILCLLKESPMDKSKLMQKSGLDPKTFSDTLTYLLDQQRIKRVDDLYLTDEDWSQAKITLVTNLSRYHDEHPMRLGIDKATLLHSVSFPTATTEHALYDLAETGKIKIDGPTVSDSSFIPRFPQKWKNRMEYIMEQLKREGIKTTSWEKLCEGQQLPNWLQNEFKNYLLTTGHVYLLNEKHLIHYVTVNKAIHTLKKATDETFTVQDAKQALNLTRKFTVLLLEILDKRGDTVRMDSKRKWKNAEL